MLKKTYADPEKITSSLICQIAGLPKPSADLDSLRGFWAKLEQYVRGIERNKPNSDHCTWTLGPGKLILTSSSSQIDQVKLLVGIDHYFDFIHSPQANGVNLIESSLGYLVAGKLRSNDTPISAHSVTVMRLAVDEPSKAALEIPLEMSDSKFAEDPIQQLWTLESVGIVDQDMSPEDKFVLEEFKNSINMVEGRYEVSLPWKVDKKQLPTNLALSRKRLNSTIHKLKQTNKYLEIYDQIIKEQLSLGFIETVPEEDQNRTNVHYLPHLPVIKDSTTTPIRIVFDASAQMDKQAPSLNDCLYSGPSLTSHLTDLLLKFRLDPFAVSADISKAFLRSTLQHHFETYPTSPEVSFLMTKFYVDNLIGSLPTTVSLYSLYKVAKEVLSDAGMPLREWISNDPTFNEMVKQEGDGTTEGSDLVKVLGLHWNYKTDHLSIKPLTFEEAPLTKRLLLKNLSKVFDPLGLFAPIIVRAKVLMQKIWKLSKRWDDVLPPELQEEW
ncbi:uncharacterized protein LOC135223337 [Macrobrachium nipponense]|uniref:uncharacterized protein LOC135223337 n=1 Tax=Macrobrachium nipponense TaxID=159736 RepID=UPI0030C8C8D2